MNVWQEFCCRKAGYGCGGFILVRLNMHLNRRIKIICPKCKHQHERDVQNGEIIDDTKRSQPVRETFTPLMSAWSETPRTPDMKRAYRTDDGSAAVIGDDAKLAAMQSAPPVNPSWAERFAGRLIGKV